MDSTNTLQSVVDQRIQMLSGILLRVGILALKMSATLGKGAKGGEVHYHANQEKVVHQEGQTSRTKQ